MSESNDNTDKNSPISSADLILKNSDCLKAVEAGYTGFYYFTTAYTAEKILSNPDENYIFVSPISKMNDLHERELHLSDGDSVYGLCFCNSDTDNIPMWYLYAGISGEGVRIGITAKKMHFLLSNIEYVYAVNNMQLGRRLERDVDFDLEYGWVFYRQDEKRIKYRGQYYCLTDSLSSFEQGNYLVKDMEWKYEKEFRLVFHVKGDPPERIAVPLDKKALMKQGGLNVTLAPELSPKANEGEKAEEYAHRFGLPVEKVRFSKLKIKMDLVSRNQYAIIDKFADVLKDLKENDVENVCKQMQTRHFCTPSKAKLEELSYV